MLRFGLIGVAAVLVLPACGLMGLDSGFRPNLAMEQRILQAEHRQVPDVDLLAMTPEMKAYVDRHVPEGGTTWSKVERLHELLFDEAHLNIQYRDDATLTAAETFEAGYANCLALINLYIAMARYLDLDVSYQTVQVRPRWNRRGELVVLSEHINALGQLGPGRRYIFDFTPDVLLQPGSANLITDHQALALYFNNMGVEALIAGDSREALLQFQYALKVDPELSLAWNNIGTTWNRLGEPLMAQYSFRKAIDLDGRSTTAISNLARHYSRHGNEDHADGYRRVLDRVNRANPYYHYIRGNVAYESGLYDDARSHFMQAIRRKDNDPDFYYALGMTEEQLGREERAGELKLMALALHQFGDPVSRRSNERLRRIDERSILRDSSPGFSIEVRRSR